MLLGSPQGSYGEGAQDESSPGDPLILSVFMQRLTSHPSFHSGLNPRARVTLPKQVASYPSRAAPVGHTESPGGAPKCFRTPLPKRCFVSALSLVAVFQQQLESMLKISSKQIPGGVELLQCLSLFSVLPCPSALPEVHIDVLVETHTGEACRADQKPTSCSQFSWLIMACAIRANHTVVCRLYL